MSLVTKGHGTISGQESGGFTSRKEKYRLTDALDSQVKLLRRAVDSPRCKFPNGKISWRAVSQYISSSGGTYDFGITTCSRKWNELTGGAAAAGGAAVDDDEDDEDQ